MGIVEFIWPDLLLECLPASLPQRVLFTSCWLPSSKRGFLLFFFFKLKCFTITFSPLVLVLPFRSTHDYSTPSSTQQFFRHLKMAIMSSLIFSSPGRTSPFLSAFLKLVGLMTHRSQLASSESPFGFRRTSQWWQCPKCGLASPGQWQSCSTVRTAPVQCMS